MDEQLLNRIKENLRNSRVNTPVNLRESILYSIRTKKSHTSLKDIFNNIFTFIFRPIFVVPVFTLLVAGILLLAFSDRRYVRVSFVLHNPDASTVAVAGDFNDWMPHTTPMRRVGRGDFEARLRLPGGRYRYRLVVDGRWSHDMYNSRVETNEYGELNSIVEVAK